MLRPEEKEVDISEIIEEARRLSEEEHHHEVIALLQPRVDELNDNADALLIYAESQIQVPADGNVHIAFARRAFRKVAKLEPKNLDAVSRLFEIYYRTGRQELAEEFGRRACELAPEDLSLHVRVGRALLEFDRTEDAISFAEKAISLEPSSSRAWTLRLDAIVAQNGGTSAEGFGQVDALLQEYPGALSRPQLLCMFARANGQEDLLEVLVRDAAEIEGQTKEQNLWLVQELEKQGALDDALEILEQTAESEGDLKSRLPILYRHFQAGSFERVVEYVESSDLHRESEEACVLYILSLWQADRLDDALETVSQLSKYTTQLSRTWQLVLPELLNRDTDFSALLAASNEAVNRYPQSSYFYFVRGVAFVGLGEVDMAIGAFRAAVQLEPRWVLPRTQLAELMLNRGLNLTAFVQSAETLRTNPQFQAASETMLFAALHMNRAGTRLPEKIRKTRDDAIQILHDTARDEQSRLFLKAIQYTFAGEPRRADQTLATWLSSQPSVDEQDYQALRLIANSERLLSRIESSASQTSGMPFARLVETAVEAAEDGGEEAALKWLDEYQVNGEALPGISRMMATAETLTTLESGRAKDAWLSLAEAYPDNLTVLTTVFRAAPLQEDPAARRQVVEMMKKASSEEQLNWQIAEMTLLLDEDDSRKAAAACALRLGRLLETASTSAQGFALLAKCYSRLEQPDKAAQTLTDAIAIGVDMAPFRIELAEYFIRRDPKLALQHALAAHAQSSQSLALRLQAVQLVLQTGGQQQAWDLLVPDLPETASESDSHFNIFTTAVLAAPTAADQDQIMQQIAPLAADSEQWLTLWLTMTRMAVTSPEDAERWLKEAETLATDLDGSQRQIATAWRSLAVRTRDSQFFERGISLIRDFKNKSADDYIALGRLYQRSGQHSEALTAFSEAADQATEERTEAIALNGVARIELETPGNLSNAEASVRRAMKLADHPSLAVMLARIQVRQGREQLALETLDQNLTRFEDSIELRILLCELLIKAERKERAGHIAEEITRLAGGNRLAVDAEKRIQQIQAQLKVARQTALEVSEQY